MKDSISVIYEKLERIDDILGKINELHGLVSKVETVTFKNIS